MHSDRGVNVTVFFLSERAPGELHFAKCPIASSLRSIPKSPYYAEFGEPICPLRQNSAELKGIGISAGTISFRRHKRNIYNLVSVLSILYLRRQTKLDNITSKEKNKQNEQNLQSQNLATETMNDNKEDLARVAEVERNFYVLKYRGMDIPAKLKGGFYGESAEKLPVVGDYVTIIYNSTGESIIQSVRERKSLLMRPDQSKTGVMQYMVANVDYCFIVTSLNDDYSYNRIARYASVALQGGAIPVVILTKTDLCNNVGRYISEVETISEKIRVHAISALYGIGLDELEEYFKPGTTICLMGSSGAGKSTLINAIAGEEIMKTSGIRESGSKGRHTTTHRQLLELKNGVFVIDTPGMREIGMAMSEEGIDNTFSDIIELESKCRFSNCRHETEPGCAVKAAIEAGELSRERLMLYKNLGAENSRNYAKKKQIAKWVKARNKWLGE